MKLNKINAAFFLSFLSVLSLGGLDRLEAVEEIAYGLTFEGHQYILTAPGSWQEVEDYAPIPRREWPPGYHREPGRERLAGWNHGRPGCGLSVGRGPRRRLPPCSGWVSTETAPLRAAGPGPAAIRMIRTTTSQIGTNTETPTSPTTAAASRIEPRCSVRASPRFSATGTISTPAATGATDILPIPSVSSNSHSLNLSVWRRCPSTD